MRMESSDGVMHSPQELKRVGCTSYVLGSKLPPIK